MSGQFGCGSSSSSERVTSRCSISPSIASSEAVISSDYKSTMSAQAAGFETAQPSFRKRRAGRFSSKLPNRPEPQSEPGFPRSRPGTDDTSSRAAFGRDRTSRPGSMRGSSMPGSRAPGSTAPPTARIRCGERKRPKSTRSQIYKKTGNLRAVQLLLGHTKLESTVRYLGIEVDDALAISEQVEL